MNKTQIIDVTRSAVITDPEAFYENLMSTGQEDNPERTIPIVAYEGYNFLPTLYGYRSYFDVTATLDIAALGSRCDTVVLYQFANYSNVLVALCEDGIWTNSGGSTSEAWVHKVTLSTPSPGSYLAWTYCVIENVLYMYRQGNGSVYKLTPTASGPVTIASFVPSFLTMTGQMGIFRANGRLGFWDSANSVSWSSLFDFTDFTPAIITLAANAIFNDVLGRIVHVQAFGSGFVIYSTKNIVGAQFNTTGSILFSAKSISEQAGIWTSKQVCQGATDMEQFAYTNTGIKRVKSDFTVEDIFVGVYDFLRESRDPVYLSFLQGRYLFLSLIDPAYISGRVSFEVVNLGELNIRLLLNGGELVAPEDVPTDIDGIPFQDALRLATASGERVGLYAQWTASGSKLVPGIVSSMEPYLLDDPFTPDDDNIYHINFDPYYSEAEILAARDSGTWVNKVSVNNSTPMQLDLGWHGAPLGTGKPDVSLTRFRNRQYVEWEEYKTKMQATISALQAVTSAESFYTDPVLYVSSPANFPTTDTGYVEFTTVNDATNGVTESDVYSGVGTYGASLTYKRSYTREYPLERRVTEEHYGTTIASPAYIQSSGGGGEAAIERQGSPGGGVSYTLIPFRVPLDVSGFSIVAELSPYISPNKSTEVNAAIVAAWESYFYSLFDFSAAYVYNGVSIPLTSLTTRVDYYNAEVYTRGLYIEASFTGDWGFGVETRIRSYALATQVYIQRTRKDVKYLRVGSSRAGSAFESILYADQEVVDWATYTTENPPEGFDFPTNAQDISIPDFSLLEGTTLPPHLDVTFPGATFLLQDATTAPIFPNYSGALVYDTGLQKWGKCKATFTALVDYSPINSNHDQVISYTNFGMDSGILKAAGTIHLFSPKCTDSFIRYGKLAFSRQGYTYPEEIQIHFRRPFTGIIGVDTSLDGRSIHSALHEEETFVSVGVARFYPSYAGKWYTVSLGGEFDLRSIEFTGRISGIN